MTYSEELATKKSDTVRRKLDTPLFEPKLSWSHYRELIRVKRIEARRFYEIEATKNNWSTRELKRQIGSLLFDRLTNSKDKKGLLELACKGQEINRPENMLCDFGYKDSSFRIF